MTKILGPQLSHFNLQSWGKIVGTPDAIYYSYTTSVAYHWSSKTGACLRCLIEQQRSSRFYHQVLPSPHHNQCWRIWKASDNDSDQHCVGGKGFLSGVATRDFPSGWLAHPEDQNENKNEESLRKNKKSDGNLRKNEESEAVFAHPGLWAWLCPWGFFFS